METTSIAGTGGGSAIVAATSSSRRRRSKTTPGLPTSNNAALKLLHAREKNNARCRNYRLRQKQKFEMLAQEKARIQSLLEQLGIHRIERPFVNEETRELIKARRGQFIEHFLTTYKPGESGRIYHQYFASGYYVCGNNFLNENLRYSSNLAHIWDRKGEAFDFLGHNVVHAKTRINGIHYEFEVRGKLRLKNPEAVAAYANSKEAKRIQNDYEVGEILYCAATMKVVFDGNKLACTFFNVNPESFRRADEITFYHECVP